MLGTEVTIKTAAAQTTTQTSETFVIPAAFDKFLLYIDVTAGATLLLDLEVQIFLPGPDSWETLLTDVPAAGGITATGLVVAALGAGVVDIDVSITDKRIPIGGQMRVVVAHGNGNAATYVVYIQPV